MPKNVSTTQYQTTAGPSAAEGLNQMFRGYGPRLFGAQQGILDKQCVILDKV